MGISVARAGWFLHVRFGSVVRDNPARRRHTVKQFRRLQKFAASCGLHSEQTGRRCNASKCRLDEWRLYETQRLQRCKSSDRPESVSELRKSSGTPEQVLVKVRGKRIVTRLVLERARPYTDVKLQALHLKTRNQDTVKARGNTFDTRPKKKKARATFSSASAPAQTRSRGSNLKSLVAQKLSPLWDIASDVNSAHGVVR